MLIPGQMYVSYLHTRIWSRFLESLDFIQLKVFNQLPALDWSTSQLAPCPTANKWRTGWSSPPTLCRPVPWSEDGQGWLSDYRLIVIPCAPSNSPFQLPHNKLDWRSNLVTRHDVAKADAAQRDEAEVASVQQAPVLPAPEQASPE